MLYAAAPVLLARLLVTLVAGPDLTVEQVALSRPGLTGLEFQDLTVRSGRVRIQAGAGSVVYTPAMLLRGRVAAVTVEHLDVRLGAATAPVQSVPTASAPPSPAALFAAIPARAVEVRELTVAVPERDFRAIGCLAFSPRGLAVTLRGVAPAQAAAFALDLGVTPDGLVSARVTEAADSADPVLRLDSTVAGDRLRLDGSVALDGFPLALVLAIAGAPPAEGHLSGRFSGWLPWPLPPAPDWRTPAIEGSVSGAWHPLDQPWQLPQLELDWGLADGVLSGRGRAVAALEGRTFAVSLTEAHLDALRGAGAARLEIGEPDAAPAYLTAIAELDATDLALTGDLQLRGGLLSLAQEHGWWPAGKGQVETTFAVQQPRPLAAAWQGLQALPWAGLPEARASGTVAGHWAPAGDLPVLRDLGGSWRLEDGALAADLQGRLAFRGLTAPLKLALETLHVDAIGAGAAGLYAAAALGIGELAPFDVALRQGVGESPRLRLQGAVEVRSSLAEAALDGWSQPFDLSAGRIAVDADLALTPAPTGRLVVALAELAGHYGEYAVEGLSSTLELESDAAGWTLQPASVTAARARTGVDLTELRGGLAWSGDRVELAAADARLLGGRLHVQPFSYAIGTGTGGTTLQLSGVDLAQILALEGQRISGRGTLHGILPVTFEGGAPAVREGHVETEPPGGVLRVGPALAVGTGQPGIDFALRALTDFRYEVLRADVDYSVAGDLTLAVHLEGRNPEVESGRPIHYNVTVNENVPTLLRALRLEDEVTRGIERRINDQ